MRISIPALRAAFVTRKRKTAVPLSLDEIKAELIRLRSHIEDSYEINHVLTFVMQSLQQASTGIEQYLRNIKIDAEMEAHRLEDLAKKRG